LAQNSAAACAIPCAFCAKRTSAGDSGHYRITAFSERMRPSVRLLSKRGRAGSVRYPLRVLGHWPKGPRRLPPSLCCYACRN
jgi:hypothetical protein